MAKKIRKLNNKTRITTGKVILVLSVSLSIFLLFSAWERNKVINVIDGDSLVLSDGRRVRLLGLDAPEMDRCLGPEAKSRLIQLALGKHIRLKNIVNDSYGRFLANVIVEDPPDVLRYQWWWLRARVLGLKTADRPLTYVNRVMVEEGLARYEFSGDGYEQTLTKAHQAARDGQIGIYSGLCRQTAPPVGKLIKANIRQGKKYYYTLNCRYYGQVILDTSYGDAWFASESEAITAGFTLASSCK
jgi:endonuclease YncB( thermonuclease family)